mgnify:CR=1 FL=1|tara:strand:+ start:139 stop:273 length:135 start_codon:yes stop_codon:yes gene_type:complete
MIDKLVSVVNLLDKVETHPGTSQRSLDVALSILTEIIKDETLYE